MQGATLGRSRRPSKPKPPSGDEKKNQLDLFLDWAVDVAKRTAAATAAARDAAAKHFEELRAGFDRRSAKVCGTLVALLVACPYNASSGAVTFTVAVATVLSALLTAVPLVITYTPRLADSAIRASNHSVTLLLIIGVMSFGGETITRWLWPAESWRTKAPQEVVVPKAEPLPGSIAPDEKSLAEEARKEAVAQAEKEAARVADCVLKENSAQAARRTYNRREKDFSKCKSEYESVITLKSLDGYCRNERGRLDAAGRILDGAVASLCSGTAGTHKAR